MDFIDCMTETDWFCVIVLDTALFAFAYLLGQANLDHKS